jgi:hypothetical protein
MEPQPTLRVFSLPSPPPVTYLAWNSGRDDSLRSPLAGRPADVLRNALHCLSNPARVLISSLTAGNLPCMKSPRGMIRFAHPCGASCAMRCIACRTLRGFSSPPSPPIKNPAFTSSSFRVLGKTGRDDSLRSPLRGVLTDVLRNALRCLSNPARVLITSLTANKKPSFRWVHYWR